MERIWPDDDGDREVARALEHERRLAGRPDRRLAHGLAAVGIVEHLAERAHRDGELAQRIRDLRRDVLVEVDRAPGATRQHADVAHREVDLRRRLGVDADRPEQPPARRRQPRRLAPHDQRAVEVARQLVDPASARERRLYRLPAASRERVGDVLQHRGELGEHRRGRLAHDPPGVDRQDERADRQRDAAAEQCVDAAGERDAAVWRLQRRDQRGRDGGLLGEHLARSEQQRDRHRQRDDERELPPAGPEPDHEQVGDRDPERHAEHDLDRAPPALALRQAERDHRRHGREERARVPDHLGRDEPGDRRRERRLEDRARGVAQPLRPHARGNARPLRRLPEQRVGALGERAGRLGHPADATEGSAPGLHARMR